MKNATQTEIEEALTCQCGCGLTVHSCNHVQCPSGIPLKREIAAQLGEGRTRAEVLAYFSTKYGEKILSAPTTTGFNLVAWVTPFAAVLVAGAVIVVVSRRWRRPPTVPPPSRPAPIDEARRARLEAELGRFDA
ncbi:MAG: cytochrome c-type biogenesis protein CcmH [Deltaproteobacteria bacterium]|nr:cytochrome c-type biogenesis protein CcmH [Deltaproteobacteria bacterium]